MELKHLSGKVIVLKDLTKILAFDIIQKFVKTEDIPVLSCVKYIYIDN